MRFLLFLLSVFVIFGSVHAQTRTITNEDLKPFRDARLAAEKDLRDNYERLGFASPEEMEKQRKEYIQERETLLQRALLKAPTEQPRTVRVVQGSYGITPVIIYGNNGQRLYYQGVSPYYAYPQTQQRSGRYFNQGMMYRATPGGVIYEPSGRNSNIWPAPQPVRIRRR